jgi:hypothetical protein
LRPSIQLENWELFLGWRWLPGDPSVMGASHAPMYPRTSSTALWRHVDDKRGFLSTPLTRRWLGEQCHGTRYLRCRINVQRDILFPRTARAFDGALALADGRGWTADGRPCALQRKAPPKRGRRLDRRCSLNIISFRSRPQPGGSAHALAGPEDSDYSRGLSRRWFTGRSIGTADLFLVIRRHGRTAGRNISSNATPEPAPTCI